VRELCPPRRFAALGCGSMDGLPVESDGLKWFYLDSTGQEFGPFHGETMREWYNQGFFPIMDDLLVRLPLWNKHVALREIYPEPNSAFLGLPLIPPDLQQQLPTHCGGQQLQISNQGFLEGHRQYAADGHQSRSGRQLGEEMPPFAAPQQFEGYYMMPQAGGYAAPSPSPAPPYSYSAMRPGFPSPTHQPGAYDCFSFPGQSPGAMNNRFQGRIKSFNSKQGFGFIECSAAHAIYGRDVFLHKAQIGDLKIGTEVTFGVDTNKQGMPQARDLVTLDGLSPGPTPASVAKGGGGGGRGKGVRGKRRVNDNGAQGNGLIGHEGRT